MLKHNACDIALMLAVVVVLSGLVTQTSFADLQTELDEATVTAQSAQAAYETAVSEQAELQRQIDEFNVQIAIQEDAIPSLQSKANDAVRNMYKSGGDLLGILESLLTGDNLFDVLSNIEYHNRVSKWTSYQLTIAKDAKQQLESNKMQVEQAKSEKDQYVIEAEAAHIAALDAQEKARKALEEAQEAERQAYLAAQRQAAAAASSTASNYSSGTSRRAATSSSWSDEESAKAYIIGKESGGNYQARNGRYYGAYQLTESYLGGDYSPENQDRIAQNYVDNRYGGWVGAAQFWDSHGWY